MAVNEAVAERVRREIEVARENNGKEIETMGAVTKAATGPAGSLPLWWEKSAAAADPNVLRVDNGGDGWVILDGCSGPVTQIDGDRIQVMPHGSKEPIWGKASDAILMWGTPPKLQASSACALPPCRNQPH